MAPSYDSVRLVDLNRYDTIMLLDSAEGVTSELVHKINHWLCEHAGGLLYVAGMPTTRTVLFPELTFDRLDEPFLWEHAVQATAVPAVEEAVVDAHGQHTGKTRTIAARLEHFQTPDNAASADAETRLRFTYAGAIAPLLTHDGQPMLARWQAPDTVKARVLFDGAMDAGPVYTAALEKVVQALDRERGAAVTRNGYWGHVVWETKAFLIDVATTGYRTLQDARPWQHRGIDIITGAINPLVRHDECTLILTDYVGPYAGGKGDWAVMARTELKEMTLPAPNILRVDARGVTRVDHIGPARLTLADTTGFTEVPDQLAVWKAMWDGKKAFSRNPVDGGQELHFTSPEAVVIRAE